MLAGTDRSGKLHPDATGVDEKPRRGVFAEATLGFFTTMGGSPVCLGGGCGVIFKLNKDGTGYTVLYDFADGSGPPTGLIEASDHALYGTGVGDGNRTCGQPQRSCSVVFTIAKDGTGYTVLHQFSDDAEGWEPSAPLLEGSDGALYGTNLWGGDSACFFGCGTVFALNKDGTGFAVLHSLVDAEGYHPPAPVTEGSDGALYGVTQLGGGSGEGTLFTLNKDGTGFGVLHGFGDPGDGVMPAVGALLEARDGLLYGATTVGGSVGNGVLYRTPEN